VVANEDSGTVSVLLGKGDGSFARRTDFLTKGRYRISVSIGDLNGDGKPDLAVANFDDYYPCSISVLFGNGDGSFSTRTDYPAGEGIQSIAVGDLDGDGRLDLAAANYLCNTVSVWLGHGDGTFGARTDYGTGDSPDYVAIGDLNGDGKPDLAVTNNRSNTVSVLFNIGDSATPTALAFLGARTAPYRVDLRWFGTAMAGVTATVYRRTVQAPWTAVGSIVGDGRGEFSFADLTVQPDERYDYRLGVRERGSEKFYGEAWVKMPGVWSLALAPPAPNPSTDRLAVALTLPDAAPAQLEVVDVAGRVVARREVGPLGPGPHKVTFSEAAGWRPGIYLIRLTQESRSLVERACVLR